jgi:hypothetical protein
MKPIDADFGVTIEYVRGVSNPEQVFAAMADLLAGFAEIDRVFIGSAAPEVATATVIEEIEVGSITTWVRSKLARIDDGALKDFDLKKQIGAAAVSAKYRVIEFLDKKAEEETHERRELLRRDLEAIAGTISRSLVPPTIELSDLAPGMNRIQEAKGRLTLGETVTLKSEQNDDHRLNLQNNDPVELPAVEAVPAVLGGVNDMVLLIKKADLIGKSQWEFRHGTTTIRANIEDEQWLTRFHEGNEGQLIPGSAMRVRIRSEYRYDGAAGLSETTYDIERVYAIIPPTRQQQAALFGDDLED